MLVDYTGSQQNHLRTPEEVLVSRSGFEMLQRFAAIIASSDDAIISNTIEGTVTSWNNGAERIFGYAAHEMLGQSISRLVSPRGGDDMAKSLDRIRRGEHVGHYEAMRRCKDGREIPVSVTISGLRDSSGECVGAVKIARDVSARKHAEMAIRTSEKLAGVSRMATSLAHDINNPLASVTNLLFLLENEELSEDGKQYLATAQRELSRVAQISAHAVGFYRSKGEPVWLSVAAILDDALALHQNRCRTLGVEVSRDYEPAPNIYSHPGELRQVMVNLIGNALDAMRCGGKLRLRVRRTTDWVTHRQGLRITVADTGDGMNAETRSRLFEPFFRTEKPIGTGMGLWICADIASKYDGRISVRSSDAREHNGSVFSLFLPL
jgi:PAS domain S-box-containing protein